MSMHEETHSLTLVKHSQRNLGVKGVKNQTTALLAGVNSRSLAVSGWVIEMADPSFTTGEYEGEDSRNVATSRLHFLAVYRREDGKQPGKSDLGAIARKLGMKADTVANGNWRLACLDGEPYELDPEAFVVSDNVDNVGYADITIPEDFEDYFQDLYGLDPHIALLKSRLEAAIESNFTNRFHTVFIGPPGCGKSAICERLKKALGDDAVVEYDGTALTSAGAIKELAEREILPRVMIVEEIEKASSEQVAAFLLGVMDQRGEIRKTTARQNIQRDAKLYCIATVNNRHLFERFQAGALASRFGRPVGFRRPSREMRALILSREIQKIDGDERWIEPTLDFCEKINEDDPRKMISICLAGKDRLLDGSYQAILEATSIDITEETVDWTTLDTGEGEGA